ETGVVLVVVLFITYILLLFSDAILRVIGRQRASVLVRVLGLILCSLAVEIVLTALGVGGWTTPPPRSRAGGYTCFVGGAKWAWIRRKATAERWDSRRAIFPRFRGPLP